MPRRAGIGMAGPLLSPHWRWNDSNEPALPL